MNRMNGITSINRWNVDTLSTLRSFIMVDAGSHHQSGIWFDINQNYDIHNFHL